MRKSDYEINESIKYYSKEIQNYEEKIAATEKQISSLPAGIFLTIFLPLFTSAIPVAVLDSLFDISESTGQILFWAIFAILFYAEFKLGLDAFSINKLHIREIEFYEQQIKEAQESIDQIKKEIN